MDVNTHKFESLLKTCIRFPLPYVTSLSFRGTFTNKQRMTQNARIFAYAREVPGINAWCLKS